MTKSVAIYGFAPQTRDFIKQSDADEVWSLNAFYNYGLEEERVTRTFEMHALWMAYHATRRGEEGQNYWTWMKQKHPFYMYMPKIRDDFLSDFERITTVYTEQKHELTDDEKLWLSHELAEVKVGIEFFSPDNVGDIRKYPLQEVIDNVIPERDKINLDVFPRRGVKPFFISSIDYMIALAILEEFDRIELYGVELREKTEWAMQKAGATYWCGVALGRGIEVWIPEVSVLMNSPLYGIEAGGESQLIPIQVPEHLKKMVTAEFDQKRSTHNHLTGRFSALAVEHKDATERKDKELATRLKEKLDELRPKIEQTWREMYMNEGAINVLSYLIDHENMKLEPLDMRTITQLQEVVVQQNEQMQQQAQDVEVKNSGGTCSYCGREDGPMDAAGNCSKCGYPILPKEPDDA